MRNNFAASEDHAKAWRAPQPERPAGQERIDTQGTHNNNNNNKEKSMDREPRIYRDSRGLVKLPFRVEFSAGEGHLRHEAQLADVGPVSIQDLFFILFYYLNKKIKFINRIFTPGSGRCKSRPRTKGPSWGRKRCLAVNESVPDPSLWSRSASRGCRPGQTLGRS